MIQTMIAFRSDVASASTLDVTRALLACGLVAGPLFVGVASLEALARPGYDLGRHPISLLSLGDFGWIQIANFIVSGLLTVAFAVGVRRVLSGGQAGTWGPLLIGVYGTGLIVAGVFVPDAALGFPPGSAAGIPSQLSRHGSMHGVGFVVAFSSLSLACLVFARRSLVLGQRAWALYAVITATVGMTLSLWPGTDGASVRYFVAAVIVWTWTVVLAVRLRSPFPGRADAFGTEAAEAD
jgi:hypothetical protein